MSLPIEAAGDEAAKQVAAVAADPAGALGLTEFVMVDRARQYSPLHRDLEP